jgi:hypothetical protein
VKNGMETFSRKTLFILVEGDEEIDSSHAGWHEPLSPVLRL